MSRVRQKDTKPEMVVRSALHGMGFRFRLHRRDLPGTPDIVLPRYRKVVFVHGCFWHQHEGCRRASRPATNIEFWNRKLDANMVRDALVAAQLRALGWEPLVVWQCATRDMAGLRAALSELIAGKEA